MNDNIALKMQQTYNIAYWGGSYYGVNDLGHVTVCPNPEMPQAAVDLAELVNRVQKSGNTSVCLHYSAFRRFCSIVCVRLMPRSAVPANPMVTKVIIFWFTRLRSTSSGA